MKIYVAGALADIEAVQQVQARVVAADHELTLDWTRGTDSALKDYGSAPDIASQVAHDDLHAVLTADALLVVATEQDGRGMFVELGAALAAASLGRGMDHVVVIGSIHHDSVFYHHSAVTRVTDVDEWLTRMG